MQIKPEESQKLNKSMKILSDYWCLQIIELLKENSSGFNDIQRKLEDISPTTLSNRLKKLTEINMLEKSLPNQKNNYGIYNLTELGRKVLPIIDQINKFIEEEK